MKKCKSNAGQVVFEKYGREHFAAIARSGAAARGSAEMSRIGKLGARRKYDPCKSPRNPRRSASHQFLAGQCCYCRLTPAQCRLSNKRKKTA